MAARLRNDLGEEITLQDGSFGEFTVLVDRAPVLKRGLWVLLGTLPPYARVLEAVRMALARGPGAHEPGGST